MAYLPDSRMGTIVIHYSATPIEQDYTVKDIDDMHRRRGFSGIGYHYFIRKNGAVERGRDMSQAGRFEQGAHSQGENGISIGICFEGGVRKAAPNVGFDSRTPAQVTAMIQLIRDLKVRYPYAEVKGHRDMPGAATQCPGFDASAWWAGVSAPKAVAPIVATATVAVPVQVNPIAALLQLLLKFFERK
jgi:N-acetylmuramoyl-L-alanine amidase